MGERVASASISSLRVVTRLRLRSKPCFDCEMLEPNNEHGTEDSKYARDLAMILLHHSLSGVDIFE